MEKKVLLLVLSTTCYLYSNVQYGTNTIILGVYSTVLSHTG